MAADKSISTVGHGNESEKEDGREVNALCVSSITRHLSAAACIIARKLKKEFSKHTCKDCIVKAASKTRQTFNWCVYLMHW